MVRQPLRQSLCNRKRLAIFGIAALLGASVSGFVIAADAPQPDRTVRPTIGPMPKDVDGDGIISDAGEERLPNMVLAYGDDGQLGYIRLDEVDGSAPASPAEALAQQEAQRRSGRGRTLGLYDTEGRRIGSLTERGPGNGPVTPPALATGASQP